MPLVELISMAQRALLLCVWVSLPVLAVGALVGLLLAVVQAATQVQDSTLSHLPKFLAVSLALALTSKRYLAALQHCLHRQRDRGG